jgi:integrase
VFLGPNGKRRHCSTKEVDPRRAQKIADRYEQAAFIARLGGLAARQARKVIGEIYEIANRQQFPSDTIRDYLLAWVETRKLTVTPRTALAYANHIEHFLRWLGPGAERLLSQLSAAEIAKFRDHLTPMHSPATVNNVLDCLRTALQAAFDDDIVDVNEAKRVKKIAAPINRSQARRPFTDEELRAILTVAGTEWRGMTLCGLYHGLRLGDVASLRWPNVVLEARELRFTNGKTGREMVIPIAEPFYRYLLEIAGDDPQGPLSRGRLHSASAISQPIRFQVNFTVS